MNSSQETSPTSQPVTNSNISSPDAELLVTKNTQNTNSLGATQQTKQPLAEQLEDFETGPLAGLSPSPFHQMTQEEQLAFVAHIQQMRQSPQTFKAEVEASARETVRAKPVKKEKVTLDEFEGLLE